MQPSIQPDRIGKGRGQGIICESKARDRNGYDRASFRRKGFTGTTSKLVFPQTVAAVRFGSLKRAEFHLAAILSKSESVPLHSPFKCPH